MKNIDRDMIINLIGPSGTGKTTLAMELKEHGYNIIHSFTTRKPRCKDEWGHQFVSELTDDFSVIENSIIPNENVIAYKEVYEGIHYWATMEQIKDKGISIYVIEPEGAEQIKQYVRDAEVITIFLSVDTIERERRMKNEGRNLEEIQKRIINDKSLFRTCMCDYVVDADREIELIIEDILKIIVRK